MINVTSPFLPPKEEYDKYLIGIWQRNWLTNNGPLVNELELRLKEYLNLNHLLFVTNGTIAIQLAIRALGLKGKIITTPFSYVATTSSIVWENCEPVFADIDKHTLNINPSLIEEAIDSTTTAILATHCFGNACDIESIQTIADRYNLKVIYDAAHCFGTKYKGKSIFSYGDISTASFHSTKLFHTIEGGAVVTNDPDLLRRIAYLRNFGHDGPEKFRGVGINGKNSEFHAAMGLCNLKYVDEIIRTRVQQCNHYDECLKELDIRKPTIQIHTDFNHSYYPIIFESEDIALRVKRNLEIENIYPRRYFYPSLSHLDYVTLKQTPVADQISSRILCLPIFHTIGPSEQEQVAQIVRKTLNS